MPRKRDTLVLKAHQEQEAEVTGVIECEQKEWYQFSI